MLAPLLLLLGLSTVNGGSLEVLLESTTGSDYYKNEPIRIGCKVSGYTNVKAVYLTATGSVGGNGFKNACVYKAGTVWEAEDILSERLGFNHFTNDYCIAAAAKPEPFVIQMTGAVSDLLEGVRFSCQAKYEDTVTVSMAAPISEVKVAPQKLILHAPPNVEIEEGKQFTFSCTSESAIPASTYRYEVTRGAWNGLVGTTNIYTPTSDDKPGIKITCSDTAHSYWKHQRDVTKYKIYNPSPRKVTTPQIQGTDVVEKASNTVPADDMSSLVPEVVKSPLVSNLPAVITGTVAAVAVFALAITFSVYYQNRIISNTLKHYIK